MCSVLLENMPFLGRLLVRLLAPNLLELKGDYHSQGEVGEIALNSHHVHLMAVRPTMVHTVYM